MNMYKIIQNVINTKNYELSDLLKKIDTIWVQGSITDSEKEELISLARGRANVQNSIDVLAKLEELDRVVKLLVERVTSLEGVGSDNDNVDSGEETFPKYVTGHWYYTGDKVSFDGTSYECIAPDGVVCVWSPSEYPEYWHELAENEEVIEPEPAE